MIFHLYTLLENPLIEFPFGIRDEGTRLNYEAHFSFESNIICLLK